MLHDYDISKHNTVMIACDYDKQNHKNSLKAYLVLMCKMKFNNKKTVFGFEDFLLASFSPLF